MPCLHGMFYMQNHIYLSTQLTFSKVFFLTSFNPICFLLLFENKKKNVSFQDQSWYLYHCIPYYSTFLGDTFIKKKIIPCQQKNILGSNWDFFGWFSNSVWHRKCIPICTKVLYYNVFPVMYYANGLEMASFQQKSTTRFTAYIIFARPSVRSFVAKANIITLMEIAPNTTKNTNKLSSILMMGKQCGNHDFFS